MSSLPDKRSEVFRRVLGQGIGASSPALLLDRDRLLHLGDLRGLAGLLTGLGRHDQVVQLPVNR